jgi:hypothetical protein
VVELASRDYIPADKGEVQIISALFGHHYFAPFSTTPVLTLHAVMDVKFAPDTPQEKTATHQSLSRELFSFVGRADLLDEIELISNLALALQGLVVLFRDIGQVSLTERK